MINKELRVIKIVNEYEIIINGGSEAHLINGEMLEVYAVGAEIIDTQTNESLGTLDYVKATVYVKTLYPKMALCKSAVDETRKFSDVLLFAEYTVTEKLNIDTADIESAFSSIQDKKVRVGDLVRKAL
ncbi:MAG: hypothetical protein LBC78_01830 [Oscillospiraceae bacterium]|jgi:nanoRNase/pAp phosphatase (c-di-AMP/oligoRNAs hydrolase)|nr:hypothetical protein [Oscillospiraceae bacterium]